MIPEVAAVLRAAEAYVDGDIDSDDAPYLLNDLMVAVEALRIRRTRPAGAVTWEETERSWGEVVVGDEVFSDNTKRWHKVIHASLDAVTGKVILRIKGGNQFTRTGADPVRVKRGVLGDANDLFQLLWSA